MSDWTDAIVGERMTVDQQFSDHVRQSRFSNQEWGLIMTAVEFEIENADDPESARVVADTESVPSVLPELENVRQGMGAMGGPTDGPGSGGSGSGDGLVDSVKSALGFGDGDGGNNAELRAAEELAQTYADQLQRELENSGKWEQVRVAYQE
ncbi:MAG: DUF5799 family protein [Halolamina sp.]